LGKESSREDEGGAKEDFGRPAAGEGHESHAFLEVAVAGEEFESGLDEGLRRSFGSSRAVQLTSSCPDPSGMRLDWSEVDALVVSGIERAGFFRFEGQIAEGAGRSAFF
jgi:hypothetical protein